LGIVVESQVALAGVVVVAPALELVEMAARAERCGRVLGPELGDLDDPLEPLLEARVHRLEKLADPALGVLGKALHVGPDALVAIEQEFGLVRWVADRGPDVLGYLSAVLALPDPKAELLFLRVKRVTS